MDFKNSEKKYWDSFYLNQKINFSSDRDLAYHHAFKDVMKNLPANSRILELACGLRCDGLEIAKAGQIVYETDISEVAVNKAQEIYERLGLVGQAKFIHCDAEQLPFEADFFDAAFISASFHHLPDPLQALREMKRVVKRGGDVILGMEPNSWPYYTLFMILQPLKALLRKMHHKTFSSIADDATHGFTKNKLLDLFKEANLTVVSIGRYKYLSELYDSGLRLFSKLFKKTFHSSRKIQGSLADIDTIIARIPIIKLSNWHWSVIAKKN